MSAEYSPQELMVVAAAREIADGEVVFVGMRLPLLAFGLAKRTHAPAAIGLFENGLVRDRVQAKSNIAVVGDARAFLYTLPSSHLHYRTIFDVADVDPTSNQKLIEAWLGPDAARLRKECTIIVDQDELDRMLATYILGRPWIPQPRPRGMLVLPPRP